MASTVSRLDTPRVGCSWALSRGIAQCHFGNGSPSPWLWGAEASPEWVNEQLKGQLGSAEREHLLADLFAIAPELDQSPLPRVLLHDDLSYHNVGFDTQSGEVLGIFDFTHAVIGDPHRDLRYAFTFEPAAEEMISTYEHVRGVALSRARLRAMHMWSALGALAWDLTHGIEEHLPARWGWIDAVAAWNRSFLRELSS